MRAIPSLVPGHFGASTRFAVGADAAADDERGRDASCSAPTRMSFVSLDQLPPAPPARTGWPWTASTPPPPAAGHAWPRITIVVPSYNQGQFIEETIRSILLQSYPDLELIVVD